MYRLGSCSRDYFKNANKVLNPRNPTTSTLQGHKSVQGT